MQIYRSPMEKILKQMEDNEIITNPKKPVRSLVNKVIYRCMYYADRLDQVARHIFHRQPRA
jgi:hypothetical protein